MPPEIGKDVFGLHADAVGISLLHKEKVANHHAPGGNQKRAFRVKASNPVILIQKGNNVFDLKGLRLICMSKQGGIFIVIGQSINVHINPSNFPRFSLDFISYHDDDGRSVSKREG
jgi:hypothetical protein